MMKLVPALLRRIVGHAIAPEMIVPRVKQHASNRIRERKVEVSDYLTAWFNFRDCSSSAAINGIETVSLSSLHCLREARPDGLMKPSVSTSFTFTIIIISRESLILYVVGQLWSLKAQSLIIRNFFC